MLAAAYMPCSCVEGVLAMALFNMLNAETVHVRTAMGGGRAGPLRIDMGSPGVLQASGGIDCGMPVCAMQLYYPAQGVAYGNCSRRTSHRQ